MINVILEKSRAIFFALISKLILQIFKFSNILKFVVLSFFYKELILVINYLYHKGNYSHAFGIAKHIKANCVEFCLLKDRLVERYQIINFIDYFRISVNKSGFSQFNGRVLLALDHTGPFKQSGYWFRTKYTIESLTIKNCIVTCITRPGFPSKDYFDNEQVCVELIDDIRFIRFLDTGVTYGVDTDKKYISCYTNHICNFIKDLNVSVIHANSNYLNGIAAVSAAKRMGILCVYELRGLWHLTRLSKEPSFGDTDAFLYEGNLEKLALQHADQVVTLSGAMKELIVSWGVAENKVHIVPNAVDVNRFVPVKADLALRQQWPVCGFIIGFIGSLTTYEGLVDLVTAVKILRKQGVSVSLVVVGSGPFEPNLNEAIKGCDFIYFPGRIPHEDVNRWYATFDCCAYPRKNDPVCRYVPPLKVLEAMAMEKPVIVSDLPPLLEMVQDGVTGLLCAPDSPESLAEKIKLLMDDKALAKQLGQEARRWVKANRTWEINAKKYMDVYEGKAAS